VNWPVTLIDIHCPRATIKSVAACSGYKRENRATKYPKPTKFIASWNKTVAVIGAGASAIEAGALVNEAGGYSEVFVRGQEAIFNGRTPRVRPLWESIKNPMTVLGAIRRHWILQQLPLSVHMLPLERRTRFVKRYLGPASPWWIKDRILGKVPIHVHHEVVKVGTVNQRVQRLRRQRISPQVSRSSDRGSHPSHRGGARS
jgi:FAD-dependent urate hydroxylase